MEYVITFLEGVISFISPCMLPMLPVYLSYFAPRNGDSGKGIKSAVGFVVGFTVVFCVLGLFAGTVGTLLSEYKTVVNIISGAVVIVFGLSYLEVINLPFFKGIQTKNSINGFFSAVLFGMIFSVSLTPCVGAFLGSALMMASVSAHALKGVLLLLSYSLGLGAPFLISAVLIEQLADAFMVIKKHYGIINKVCGIFLIVVGIAMMTGLLGSLLGLFS